MIGYFKILHSCNKRADWQLTYNNYLGMVMLFENPLIITFTLLGLTFMKPVPGGYSQTEYCLMNVISRPKNCV